MDASVRRGFTAFLAVLLVTAGIVPFIAITPARAAPTQVGSCTTLSSPGTYELSGNITNASALECIEITSGDVLFDGNGYTIDGQGAVESVGVSIQNADTLSEATPLRNVTVRDIEATNWQFGIRGGKMTEGTVADVTLRSNRYGVGFLRSSQNTIESAAIDSSGYYGVFVGSASSENTIRDGTVSESAIHGVYSSGENNTYRNLTVSASEYAGFRLNATNASEIVDSTVRDSGTDGVQLRSTEGAVVRDTIVENNSGDGVLVEGGTEDRFVESVFRANGKTGIRLRGASTNTTLVNSTAIENGEVAFNSSNGSTSTATRFATESAVVSFDATDVRIDAVASPPPDPADANRTNIGQYLEVLRPSQLSGSSNSSFDVEFHYTEANTSNISESTLQVWEHPRAVALNSSSSPWSVIASSSVDTRANTVSANGTSIDSVLAPLGTTAPASAPAELNITNRADPPNNGSDALNYTLRGTISDAEVGTDNLTVAVNGQQSQVPISISAENGTTTFAANLTLTEQVNRIEILEPGGSSGTGNGTGPSNRTLLLDGDGLRDTYETSVLETDPLDPDSDSPLTDADEADNEVVDGAEDFDNDTVVTYYETFFETNPLANDTDGDGLTDSFETEYSIVNPILADSDGDNTSDAAEDSDSDGLSNARESSLRTSPDLADTDGDGLNDSDEIDVYDTDALSADTDEDGLFDGDEASLGTNLTNADTDGDGVVDGNESYTTTASNESIGATVTVTGSGNVAEDLTIERSDQRLYNSSAIRNASASSVVRVATDREVTNGTVTLSYNESDPASGDESTLALYRYNDTYETFLRVDSTVDTANNTISADSGISTYVVFNESRWTSAVRLDSPYPISGSPSASTSSSTSDSDSTADSSTASSSTEATPTENTSSDAQTTASSTATNSTWVFPQRVDDFNDNDISDWETVEEPVPGGEGGFIQPVKRGSVDARNGQLELDVYGCYRVIAVKDLGSYDGPVRVSYDWSRESDDTYHETFFEIQDNGTDAGYTVLEGEDIPFKREGSPTSGSVTVRTTVNDSAQLRFVVQPSDKYRANSDTCRYARFGTTLQIDNLVVSEVVEGPNDTDNDGLPNILEERRIPLANGDYVRTDPNVSDTDGDGLLDGEEVLVDEEYILNPDTDRKYFASRSDPTDPDTDNDGLGDFEEVRETFNATFTDSPEATTAFLNALSTDNGSANPEDALTTRSVSTDPKQSDTDGDGLADLREVELGTDPSRADTDGDSLTDSEEAQFDADPTLFDAQGPEIDLRLTNYYKPAGSLEATYAVGFGVSDPSGIDRVAVIKDGDSRFEDDPGLARTASYNREFTAGAIDTGLDGLGGTAVDIETEDRHGNLQSVRAIQQANVYGTIAGRLGAENAYSSEVATSAGALSGFSYGAGEQGAAVAAFADDPLGTIASLTELITLLENAGVLDELLAQLPEQVDRQQQLSNPYNEDSQPQLYGEFRRSWYAGYGSFFLVEAILPSKAADVARNSDRLADGVDRIKTSDRLEPALDSLRTADSLSPGEQVTTRLIPRGDGTGISYQSLLRGDLTSSQRYRLVRLC